MTNPTTNLLEYWDRYAKGITTEPDLDTAFGWTQWDGHGPGTDLLGDPATALELGCGRGIEVASLAREGVKAEGIDISPAQVQQARERWGPLGTRFHQGDAIEFLGGAEQRWDAIYSVWGAIWFTDPTVLLPLVHARLTRGGRLVFAHAPAVTGAYGVQGMYANGFRGRDVGVHRWAYEPQVWEELLQVAGFTGARVWVEPAPEADHVGTLIGVAHR
ncbi:class I SAM-dependent methyltransferase [Nocardiopsis nanhaiensis]